MNIEIHNYNSNNNNNSNSNKNQNINSIYNDEYPNLNRLHKYNQDSDFFIDINNERKNILMKQKCYSYSIEEINNSNNNNQTSMNIDTFNQNNNNQQQQEEYNNTNNKIKYICTCPIEFDSLIDYENHYHSIHKNFCTICKKKSYPSYKLLECHILETHDTMFDLLCVKQKMFSCFVCDKMFWSDHSRKLHLVDFHKYPVNYYFHTKKRAKELDQLRINYINKQQKQDQQQNNDNSNNKDDEMVLDEVVSDLQLINTKD